MDNPVVRQWANKTLLTFQYRQKNYYEIPLADFINKSLHVDLDRGIHFVGEDNVAELSCEKMGLETVRLQENLGYGVTVLSEQSATRDLREYLAGEWMDRAYRAEDIAVSGIPSPRDYPRLRNRGKDFRDGINRLQTIINLTQSGQHKDELAKALKLLRPSSTFSLRVHLNSCDIDEETCRFCPGGFISTNEGKLKIDFGDWVVTGVKGEKRPMTNEIFKLTYELVE